MQTSDVSRLISVKPGDFVYATFGNIDDTVDAVEGWVVTLDKETVVLREEDPTKGKKRMYGTWQMLSLICPTKNASFIRQGNVYTNLERLTRML